MENKGEIFVSSSYISPKTPSKLVPYLFETHIFGHTFFDDYLQKNSTQTWVRDLAMTSLETGRTISYPCLK